MASINLLGRSRRRRGRARKAGLKSNGKLRKGCRFVKGGRIVCRGTARRRRRRR